MAKRIAPPKNPVEIVLDGKPVTAEQGEPIAHALIAAGKGALIRSAKLRRPRGPWCLRGACDGCLARVDGVPNVMTCMRAVRGGEKVESQNVTGTPEADLLGMTDWLFPHGIDHHHLFTTVPGGPRMLTEFAKRVAGLGTLPSTRPPVRDVEVREVRTMIVGGGPAGISVAFALCALGERPLIVDDGPLPGASLLSLGYDRLQPFLSAHPTDGATWLRNATAAGVFDGQVLVVSVEETLMVRPRALILATGAHDRGPLFDGNDVPGVMAARAVARLATCGISVGQQVVVAGDGLFAEAIDRLLGEYAVIERVGLDDVQQVEGRTRVKGVVLRDGRRIPAQALAVDGPRSAAFELAVQAGATVTFYSDHGYVPQVDTFGRAKAGLWCVGECVGEQLDLQRMSARARQVASNVVASL